MYFRIAVEQHIYGMAHINSFYDIFANTFFISFLLRECYERTLISIKKIDLIEKVFLVELNCLMRICTGEGV